MKVVSNKVDKMVIKLDVMRLAANIVLECNRKISAVATAETSAKDILSVYKKLAGEMKLK